MRFAALIYPILALAGVAAGDVRIVAGPWLQNVTPTSAVVMWETDAPAPSIVEYGRSATFGQRASSESPASIHEVTLTGLMPETNYFYRAVSGAATSETSTFQTAVRPNSAFAFVVVGDNRTHPENWKRIADRAHAERPNFVLNVGDVVTDGNVKDQWLTEWILPAAQLMRRVPVYVAIGNHEENSHWFYDYVSYPKPENYYSFDFGNAHFAIIDSNQPLGPRSPQYQWLDKDLARTRATWKFVAHHHPPYSSDKNDYGDTEKEESARGDDNVRSLVPLYEKHRVDICWYGHIHSYERTWPLRQGAIDEKRGVVYIQTGGGGAPLEEFAPTRSWFTAKVNSNYQYCLVAIHGKTLHMMAYDIDGRLFDVLELKK
ncbi:MAG: metallophosphoesterase family protein [Candidatus Hydrogenedentes bacterium]|nr:metallophosphoesterase family protein [Candidatus Hydrogenedentota bacterium]